MLIDSPRATRLEPLEYPLCLAYPRRLASSAWSAHIPFAMLLVEALRPRLVVELGTFTGVSYCAFCQAVKELRLPTRCFAIDTWRGDEQAGFYETEVLQNLRAHHDPLYRDFSTLMQCDFDDALSSFEDGTIDLLHIDGFHAYEAVKHDFESWLPKMSERGVVLFHDTNVRERDFGVWRLWEEVKSQFPHFEFTHQHGLGIIQTGAQASQALRPLFESSEAEAALLREFFEQLGERIALRIEKDEERKNLSEHIEKQEQAIDTLSLQCVKSEATVNSLSAQLNALSTQFSTIDARLNGILNSRAWRWVNRYGRAKNLLRSLLPRRASLAEPAASPKDELRASLDSKVPRALIVGKGSALYVSGWCFHERHRIERLHLSLNGVAHPLKTFGMARRDVWEQEFPETDPLGHSYRSGFWTIIPVAEIDEPITATLTLQATLDDRQTHSRQLATLELLPSAEEESITLRDSSPPAHPARIAICMTAYNPPLDLFRRQIESIKAQTLTDWTCVISDDGSQPASLRRMREIIKGDARFHLAPNESRLGFYRNFERCLSLVPAQVEFVALCDHDDYWHPDKLETLLSAFDEKTSLVYSDMNIIDGDGRLLSPTYWTTRPNNYRNFASLILANTITGAASMFPKNLLTYLLPFPERIGDAFHDHWIGCVALATGEVMYVDRPLYDYVQHSSNVLGHFAPAGGGAWKRLKGALKDARGGRESLRRNLAHWQAVYFGDLLRLQVIAHTIKLRCADHLSKGKRRTLERIINADESTVSTAWLALRNLKRLGRVSETLGAERSLLRAILWKRAWALQSRLRPLAPAKIGRTGSVSAEAEAATKQAAAIAPEQVRLIQQKIAPLRLNRSPQAARRINLLIPTINFDYFFGGYITKLNLARCLADSGYKVRIVIVDHCDFAPLLWRRQINDYQGLGELFDQVETAYAHDRSLPLEVSPADVFIATTWWTAHIAHQATTELGEKRFIYLIQEYEPFTFPMGTLASLAMQSYSFPHYGIFSTELLRDYFRRQQVGLFADDSEAAERRSLSFQNTITDVGVIKSEQLAERKIKKLLLYARPEAHAARNMFELALLSLARAIESGYFGADWEFYGVGTINKSARIKLTADTHLELLPRQSPDVYRELLRSHDLGLSFMYTPHPSLVPIEMASAGMIVVTNTYANKTREKLSEISSNIIAVEPTIESISLGMKEAVARIEDYDARTQGSHVRWCTSWDETFDGEFMNRVTEFIEGVRQSHAD